MKSKFISFASTSPWVIGSSIILSNGCTTTKHIEVCESEDMSHVCPEIGHGPCPLCPVEEEEIFTWYQAYDEKWYSDPSINPIFINEWEAKEYAKRNSMSELSNTFSGHEYVVRVINHRYEVRQVNDVDDDILHTTNNFNDAYKYVVEYNSAHSDLVIYDLKTGRHHEETP